MELPIFSDNLKSSASWTAELAREQENWKKAVDSSAPHDQIESLVREKQVEQMLLRAGQGIDRHRLKEDAVLVSSWAVEPEARLTVERLLELHRSLTGASQEEDIFRQADPLPLKAMHDPVPALLLPKMLDHAFDWFTAPSFDQLHPVEQATVVYLRLLDLHPFPSHTEVTAQLAASFYTERAGLPALIIFADEETMARYSNALEAAFRMLTQPLVEFFAEMLTRTMRSGLLK